MVSLFVFLLTGLSTSSFFLSEYLTQIIAKNEHSEAQLSFAIEQENLNALNYALKHSVHHSAQWLTLAKTLAKTQGEAAYQLALYYQKTPKKKIFWFKNASRLGYHPASLALAQHFFEQNELTKSAETLSIISSDSSNRPNRSEKIKEEALILSVNIAINLGNINRVENIITQHDQVLKATTTGILLLKDIEKYQILMSKNQTSEPDLFMVNCENSIQLFATRLAHLKQVENIIEDFKIQPLYSAICFAPVRYMPINALDCNKDQNVAIRCDEVKLAIFADSINTRYVGIMLPKGGANVHLGMLYFDSQDTVDVVAHEISHLLGFVDEYPLKAEHVACLEVQKEPFSQNIAVLKNTHQGEQKTIRANVLRQLAWSKYIKNSTPILHTVTDINGNQHWQLGTPEKFQHEIGVFKSPTCNSAIAQTSDDFSAYKGLAQRTKLQYFSLSFPTLYTLLLQENSIEYKMPSFHYNIALAYFQQSTAQESTAQESAVQESIVQLGASQQLSLQHQVLHQTNIEQANYWLEQAAKWEHDLLRHKKIRQGGF